MASGARILLVDDDPNVTDVMGRYLEREGFAVEVTDDGEEALAASRRHWPDLVLLDLMLPRLSGIEVFRQLREIGPVPVVMLTALGDPDDRIVGLELGADDYVAKPFSPREVTARIAAVLKRAHVLAGAELLQEPALRFGDVVVDVGAQRVTMLGRQVELTPREFELLVYLVRHPQVAFRREKLLEAVWGWAYGDTSTVTVHMRRLREKTEADPSHPRHIVTVWGVGYRFEP
jgi:DNA-binding response OmpR family regulator